MGGGFRNRKPNNADDCVPVLNDVVAALATALTSQTTDEANIAALETLVNGTVTSEAGGTLGTIAAANMINSALLITSGTTSTLTTDSANNIITALGSATQFLWLVKNGGSGTLTMTGGSGVTFEPSASNAPVTVTYSVFLGVVTAASTVVLFKLVNGTFA